jgi:hypothetical protein
MRATTSTRAVKEKCQDAFAEAFASAGLGAIVFDNRNFGASDGEPRQEINPCPSSSECLDVAHPLLDSSPITTLSEGLEGDGPRLIEFRLGGASILEFLDILLAHGHTSPLE